MYCQKSTQEKMKEILLKISNKNCNDIDKEKYKNQLKLLREEY